MLFRSADVPADRAPPLEEMLSEAAVDDRDRRLLLGIGRREVAPLEHRDLHRREVAGRERVHERLHVLAVGDRKSVV